MNRPTARRSVAHADQHLLGIGFYHVAGLRAPVHELGNRPGGEEEKWGFWLALNGRGMLSSMAVKSHAFLDSSTVEQAAVNRKVVGSNPTRGAR